jgi:hypothetical protein
MAAKAFKELRSTRPSAAELVDVARSQDPSMPPAVVTAVPNEVLPEPSVEMVQLNVRVRRGLADALADAADRDRVSQKVLVCRALAAAGFPVDPSDLRDRTIRTRRGTASRS